MKKLVTMTITASVDGDDNHLQDSTETHGNTWPEVYKGMLMIRDEIDRQIKSAKLCPYNPKTLRNQGRPEFDQESL